VWGFFIGPPASLSTGTEPHGRASLNNGKQKTPTAFAIGVFFF
jgi:hypothetical protein